MTDTLEDRIRRAVQEDIAIVPYDPLWPVLFLEEKEHLLACLPCELIGRIEHFGSTAVPVLAAKPIIDMLVEVASLDEAKRRIVPILELQGTTTSGGRHGEMIRRPFMPGLSSATCKEKELIIFTWLKATLSTGIAFSLEII